MFFNQDGILNIDEAVAENPSFKKIMEDGMVTDQEVGNAGTKSRFHVTRPRKKVWRRTIVRNKSPFDRGKRALRSL